MVAWNRRLICSDVFAVLNGLDDGGVGAGAADARRSSSFTSEASLKRGGGWVKCWVGLTSMGKTGLPSERSGRSWSSLLTPTSFCVAVKDELAAGGAEGGVAGGDGDGCGVEFRGSHLAGDRIGSR